MVTVLTKSRLLISPIIFRYLVQSLKDKQLRPPLTFLYSDVSTTITLKPAALIFSLVLG